MQVLLDENLAENAEKMGEILRDGLLELNHEYIKIVRGKGLLNAIVVQDIYKGKTAWDFCLALKDNGLLAKPTHGDKIRFAPPLIITEEQILECVQIIKKTLEEF
jgi:ornithine--oxo-acid transaminase